MKTIAIFDMDGTLIDSGEDITHSINYVRNALYGLEPMSVKAVVDAINAPVRNLSEIFYGRPLYEPAARSLFEEHYHEQCIQNVIAYEGIQTVLEILKNGGVKLGIATNAPSVFACKMMEHLELAHYFDLIVGADNVEHPKPDPQMLESHLHHHRFACSTDTAWMIGDNSKDMEAASKAGIKAIFAGWGFAREGEGDHRASHPMELLEIICPKG